MHIELLEKINFVNRYAFQIVRLLTFLVVLSGEFNVLMFNPRITPRLFSKFHVRNINIEDYNIYDICRS